MDRKEIAMAGVKKAVEDGKKKGLKIGQVVAHPDDPTTGRLVSKKGNVATVEFLNPSNNSAKSTKKTFPLDQLFDPNIASDFALSIRDEQIARQLPSGSQVVRFGKLK